MTMDIEKRLFCSSPTIHPTEKSRKTNGLRDFLMLKKLELFDIFLNYPKTSRIFASSKATLIDLLPLCRKRFY